MISYDPPNLSYESFELSRAIHFIEALEMK